MGLFLQYECILFSLVFFFSVSFISALFPLGYHPCNQGGLSVSQNLPPVALIQLHLSLVDSLKP